MAKCFDYKCEEVTITYLLFHHTSIYTHINLGSDGCPVINANLMIFTSTNLQCSQYTNNTIDIWTGVVSKDRIGSVAIGSNGLPIIAYARDGFGVMVDRQLRITYCTDPMCLFTLEYILDESATIYDNGLNSTNVTIGSDGLPLITYYDQNGKLKVAHCTVVDCSEVLIQTLEVFGQENSGGLGVVIGSNGLPIISHYNPNVGSLRLTQCLDVNCSSNVGNRVLNDGDIGKNSNIVIRDNKLPMISYYNTSDNSLELLLCYDENCAPKTIYLEP